jgi:ABC-type polar amino acid transport system ATPase subunit
MLVNLRLGAVDSRGSGSGNDQMEIGEWSIEVTNQVVEADTGQFRTGGTVTWNGVDIAKHSDDLRQVLGYLPQDFGVYPNLNALEDGYLYLISRAN